MERRGSNRVRCNLSSSFMNFDSAAPWSSHFASIKDISRGGLRLRTHAFVLLSDRLSISFNLPQQEKPVEAKVLPAWISEIPNTEIYEVGVRFIELSEKDKGAIESFC